MKNFLKIVAAGILLAGTWCGVAVAREAGTSFVLSDNVPAPKWDEGYGVGDARRSESGFGMGREKRFRRAHGNAPGKVHDSLQRVFP